MALFSHTSYASKKIEKRIQKLQDKLTGFCQDDSQKQQMAASVDKIKETARPAIRSLCKHATHLTKKAKRYPALSAAILVGGSLLAYYLRPKS
ncbi:hypothetical protein [Bartonella sp. DGB2]|uniref:hypothetical protein n=1 Tax=Bartonella sp. DGB2 TaxID=3388426 RepID=UPI00398FB80A